MFFLILVFLGAFYVLWVVLTKESLDLPPPEGKMLNEHQTNEGK